MEFYFHLRLWIHVECREKIRPLFSVVKAYVFILNSLTFMYGISLDFICLIVLKHCISYFFILSRVHLTALCVNTSRWECMRLYNICIHKIKQIDHITWMKITWFWSNKNTFLCSLRPFNNFDFAFSRQIEN